MVEETVVRMEPLVKSMAALVSELAKELDEDQALVASFALFLARCQSNETGVNFPPYVFSKDMAHQRPRLYQAVTPLDRILSRSGESAAAAQRLVALLDRTDVETVLDEAFRRGHTQRPLVHFFESLLTECDARLRKQRGVYFTPQPLVQFIVRSVDTLLRRELGLDRGLATGGREICVVDPACGGGAFLLDVVAHIREFFAQSDGLDWHQFVSHALPNQLVGIDVMPACCRAVELLLELELEGDEQRDGNGRVAGQPYSIHCGNALDEIDFGASIFEGRIPVILGNPPYSNFGRRNRGEWILRQLSEYKSSLNEQKINLDDDFIKFIRWAQYWIDRAGRGLLAMVTNNTYLTGLTHRQMRASLANSFDTIHILDLHGNSKMQHAASEAAPDQNVFPIQQGVAIGLFVKSGHPCGTKSASISHSQLRGPRAEKLRMLSQIDVGQVNWTPLQPSKPHHFFVPRRQSSNQSYEQWPRLDEIFCKYLSGVQTKRDGLFVGFTREEIEDRMRRFLDGAARGRFEPDVPVWLQRKASDVTFDRRAIRPYMVAPFDVRWIYYDPLLLGRARYEVMRHVDSQNTVLVFARQTTNPGPYDQILATNMLVSDRVFYSAHGAPFAAPLFLNEPGERVSNLAPTFLAELTRRLGIPHHDEDHALPNSIGALDVFHWIYASALSPDYRERFRAALCIDFPRIPWPNSVEEFVRLGETGRQLLSTHLAASDPPDQKAEPLANLVLEPGYPRWEPSGRLALSGQHVWPGLVEEPVWRFRWGGYPVLLRWLKQRRHRTLGKRDQDHLRQMIATVRHTVQWMVTAEKGTVEVIDEDEKSERRSWL